MRKYCGICRKKIKGNDFVDMSELKHHLFTSCWHRSCFLVMLYETIDAVKLEVNALSARLEHVMENMELKK